MKVTDFPPEILRDIIELSIASWSSYSCYENVDVEEISPRPAKMTFDSFRFSSNDLKTSSQTSVRGVRASDKLSLSLVCRPFWAITNEFLYRAVTLSNSSQAINLAHGFTRHAVHGDPAPSNWVKELEIKSYFELDVSTSKSLKCILEHCTRVKALRISGSFLERHHPSDMIQILSAIPANIVHFEYDAMTTYTRYDRELELSQTGFYDALERVRPTLRVSKILASRFLSLFASRGSVLDCVTHLELCFCKPDLQIMLSDANENVSVASWRLDSLTHLAVSYVSLNRDDTPVKFYLSAPPPSSMIFPIRRRVTFPLHDILNNATNLLEFSYSPFSLRTASL